MPFSDDALERAIVELSGRVPLAVSEHEIVLHGSCRACAVDAMGTSPSVVLGRSRAEHATLPAS